MSDGNGDSDSVRSLTINVDELRPDWFVIRPNLSDFRKLVELERIPILLEQTLITWGRENPEFKVRSSLGVVEGGFTIAIHVWVDRED